MATLSAQPPPDLFPGAVDRGDGCVTFTLYAPGKESVSVIGEFNGWDRHADPLQVTPAGLWWTEKHMAPGAYTYQFAVDADSPQGEIVICDPYARELADDSAYDPPRAIVEVGRQPYRWQHDTWQRPAFKDLIIMEIHVGDFTPEGTLPALTARLPYLRDLGINAIELMPIYEFKGDLGWGYNPAYFFTVEKSYGTQDDLRELIDQAHASGIAVIFDMVLAHTAHRHPFNKLYPFEQSPWYGPGCGEVNQFGFPPLDYTKGPTQDFARDVEHYWLREFHIDGLRYDYCHGIGCRGDLGMPHLISAARAANHELYLIAEYSPEKTDEVNMCGIDGAWHIGGSYAIKALLCEGECGTFNWEDFERCLEVLDPWEYGYAAAALMVNFLESHDEQRVVYDMHTCGYDQAVALRKSALGATVLFTMPGEPMLYHGQELGEGTPRRTNERNTLHWEALDTPGGRNLHDHYKKLAWLRHNHPCLRGETYSLDGFYPEQKSAVYRRWTGEAGAVDTGDRVGEADKGNKDDVGDVGDEIVVALNFSPDRQAIVVPFPRGGRWHDEISGQTIETPGETTVELEPSSSAVYVRE